MNAGTGKMAAHDHDDPRLVGDAHVRPGEVVAYRPRPIVPFSHRPAVHRQALVTLNLSRREPVTHVDVVVGPRHPGRPCVGWGGAAHGWRFVVGSRGLTWALWRCKGS